MADQVGLLELWCLLELVVVGAGIRELRWCAPAVLLHCLPAVADR